MHHLLQGITKNKRIASGYLFVGPPDSGKLADALAFAAELKCGKLDCVQVEPDGASLKIEQIRDLQGRVRYGANSGEYLLVIVDKADTLTEDAAAAFLKTLEEPPPGVVFILLADREDRILPTIASRCQRIVFGEIYRAWSRDPELASFYADLKAIKQQSVIELFAIADRLEKEKERIEALLYDLVHYAKEELGDLSAARILLDTVKNIKRKANFRLSLEVACLRLNAA